MDLLDHEVGFVEGHVVPAVDDDLFEVGAQHAPPLLDGRLPTSDDEIAFGRLTAADIGAQVGEAVELLGPTR